jgi:hypothetical protein
MSSHEAVLLGARKTALPDLPEVAISDATIKTWLGVIDSSAASIDNYLLPSFIGGYELAAISIEWDRDKDALHKKTGIPKNESGSEARKLAKFLGILLDHPVQHETAQGVIDYMAQL